MYRQFIASNEISGSGRKRYLLAYMRDTGVLKRPASNQIFLPALSRAGSALDFAVFDAAADAVFHT